MEVITVSAVLLSPDVDVKDARKRDTASLCN